MTGVQLWVRVSLYHGPAILSLISPAGDLVTTEILLPSLSWGTGGQWTVDSLVLRSGSGGLVRIRISLAS